MSDSNDDARDERVAGLLAVEPLDDVTRRRLVGRALDAGSRRRPWLVAAAAAAALVIGGGAWLVARSGGSGSHRTVAAPTVPSAGVSPGGPRAGAQLAPSALPMFLGDFGDLNDPTAIARLRAAAAAPPAGSSARSPAAQASPAEHCDPAAGPVRATATGTLDGRPVVVLVVGDHLTAVTIAPCEVRPLS